MSESLHANVELTEEERKQRLKEWANSDLEAAPIYREYYKQEYGEDPCQ